jgi:hypothetical protein
MNLKLNTMRSIHSLWRLVPLYALVSLVVLSCQKNDHPPTASQQSQMQTLLMNATNDVVQAGTLESQDVNDIVGPDSGNTCRVITYEPSKNVYPHKKIVDFGSGCTGTEGITRKGKKIITFYANPDSASAGTMFSKTTYSNYYEDDINVTGIVQSYIEATADPGPKVIKNVSNKGLLASNGDSKTFTATNYWKQIEGANTATHQDDMFQITGSAQGNETLDGATAIQWTSKIDDLNAVIKPADCFWRIKGSIDVSLHIVTGGGSDFTEVLDYGNGDCDNKATLSINGGTPQDITLPLYFWPLSL